MFRIVTSLLALGLLSSGFGCTLGILNTSIGASALVPIEVRTFGPSYRNDDAVEEGIPRSVGLTDLEIFLANDEIGERKVDVLAIYQGVFVMDEGKGLYGRLVPGDGATLRFAEIQIPEDIAPNWYGLLCRYKIDGKVQEVVAPPIVLTPALSPRKSQEDFQKQFESYRRKNKNDH